MDVNDHDYIIIAIIAVIILVQLFVFIKNFQKIHSYKKTIKNADKFKIVEVEIPEDEIKEIEVEEILNNREAYQKAITGENIEPLEEDDDLIENQNEELLYNEAQNNGDYPNNDKEFEENIEYNEDKLFDEEPEQIEDFDEEEVEIYDEGLFKQSKNSNSKK